jgi:hypothetical protein
MVFYKMITVIDEFDKSFERNTKVETSTIYSEFQTPGVAYIEVEIPSDDISSFLIRSRLSNNPNDSKKIIKSKFANKNILQPDEDDISEESVQLSSHEHKEAYQNAKFRSTMLLSEEEGELNKVSTNSYDVEMLKVEELAKICSQLDYILMPVFSGNDVNPLINKLDTKRLDIAIDKKKYDSFRREINGVFNNSAIMGGKNKYERRESFRSNVSNQNSSSQNKNSVRISELDKEVIDNYIQLKNQLEIKKLPKLFIDVKECSGIIPESRELATLCTYRDSIYLFGGIGSKRFDFLSEYDMHQERWFKHMPKNLNYTDFPVSRFGHTMVNYNNNFILFGGCGTYSEKLKVHEGFNDVRMFNIKDMQWEKADYYMLHSSKQFEPEKRMYHAAAVL